MRAETCVALRFCVALRCVEHIHNFSFARALAIRAAVMMASVDELKVALLSALHLRQKRKKRKTAKRRMWVRYIFTRRQQQGEYHNLLRVSDPESHFRYLRMSKERFDCRP